MVKNPFLLEKNSECVFLKVNYAGFIGLTTLSWERRSSGASLQSEWREWTRLFSGCFFIVSYDGTSVLPHRRILHECRLSHILPISHLSVCWGGQKWRLSLLEILHYTFKAYYFLHIPAEQRGLMLLQMLINPSYVILFLAFYCGIHLVGHKSDFSSNKPGYFIDVANIVLLLCLNSVNKYFLTIFCWGFSSVLEFLDRLTNVSWMPGCKLLLLLFAQSVIIDCEILSPLNLFTGLLWSPQSFKEVMTLPDIKNSEEDVWDAKTLMGMCW